MFIFHKNIVYHITVRQKKNPKTNKKQKQKKKQL